jgi:hypothetical protein
MKRVNNKNSNQRRARKGKNAAGQNRGMNTQNSYVAPLRTTQLGFPDRMETTLSFFSAPSFAPITGASAFAFRYTPSSAFDVEPLLGGITMPGFDEFAAVYASYRVLSSRIVVKMAGLSTSPVTLIVLPLNLDPGAAPTVGTIISWRGQPYAKSKLVGSQGSPAVTIVHEMTTAKMFGSNMVLADDNFAALVTASPANNWYWAVAIYQNVVFASNPVIADVQVLVNVQFYDRKYLVT